MSLYEKWEIITEIFDSWKFEIPVFFISEKSPKKDKFFDFLPYIERATISLSQS